MPFFPFSKEEAAVVADKYLLLLGDCVREPINTKIGDWRGHIHLETHEDGQLCRKIVNDSYFSNAEARNGGARVIRDQVEEAVESMLNDKWAEMEGDSTDDLNSGPYYQFEVELRREGHEEVLKVLADGKIRALRPLLLEETKT